MESWDDDNFEPPTQIQQQGALNLNKWEGEDEDDDVKENWEDEDEEKEQNDENRDNNKAVQQPKKKTIGERIAEKERLRREEYEKRLTSEKEEGDGNELSPEEKMIREKESDLNLALETTFIDDVNTNAENVTTTINIDINNPETREDFEEYSNSLARSLQMQSKKAEYPNFVENLIRNLCATLTSQDIKKVKTTIDNLYMEKQKVEKGDKAKNKNKGKGKAKLKLEDENQFSAYVDDYNEYDDFM